MITVQALKRAELFASFTEKPILYIFDLFGDHIGYWFVCYDFTEANPSNHIYDCEMRNGICINDLISSPQEFDKQLFMTKLIEIRTSSLKFHNSIKWVKIK